MFVNELGNLSLTLCLNTQKSLLPTTFKHSIYHNLIEVNLNTI